MNEKTSEHWHLSKRFNLSFLLAVILQTVALAWFMAQLDSRTKQNAVELARHDARIVSVETTVHDQAVTLARMDENIAAIKAIIEKAFDL